MSRIDIDDYWGLGHARRDTAAIYQQDITNLWETKLTEMALSRFVWQGLPDEIDGRFIEKSLFAGGLSVFYHNRDYDKFMALRGAPAGVMDYQDNYTSYNVMGNMFVNDTIKDTNCVPIWANQTRRSDIATMRVYARRFARMDRTIEINTDNARQPRILVSDENTKLAMENVNQQLDEGTPTLKVRQSLDPVVSSLDMGIDPRLFDAVGNIRNREFQMCLSLLGIQNANTEKKERMNVDEVAATSDVTNIIRGSNLNARRQAAKAINKKYGLGVEVHYANDLEGEIVTANLAQLDLQALLDRIGETADKVVA